jgi:hypothetical protein
MQDTFGVRYSVLLKIRSQLLNDLQQVVSAGVDWFGSGGGDGQAAGSRKDGKETSGGINARNCLNS